MCVLATGTDALKEAKDDDCTDDDDDSRNPISQGAPRTRDAGAR